MLNAWLWRVTLPTLAEIGALRAHLSSLVEDKIGEAKAASKDKAKGQGDLFGGAVLDAAKPKAEPATAWTVKEILANEKEALGFYITAHPLDYFEESAVAAMISHTVDQLSELDDKAKVRLCGIANSVEIKTGKSGKQYVTFSLEDRTGACDCTAWQEVLKKHEADILCGEPIFVSGRLDKNDERYVVIIDFVERVEKTVTKRE